MCVFLFFFMFRLYGWITHLGAHSLSARAKSSARSATPCFTPLFRIPALPSLILKAALLHCGRISADNSLPRWNPEKLLLTTHLTRFRIRSGREQPRLHRPVALIEVFMPVLCSGVTCQFTTIGVFRETFPTKSDRSSTVEGISCNNGGR